MKGLFAFVATSTVLATGLASLDLLSPPDGVLSLPPQLSRESLSNFLDRLFFNETGDFSNNTYSAGPKRKRVITTADATGPYTESCGLHQSSWNDETGSETITYNISADFSNRSTGLKLSTDIGDYTFSNGTTTNDTKIGDIVADVYSLRHSRQSPNLNYANHTAVVARLGLAQADQLLNNGLICQNTSSTAQNVPVIRDELRHLLMNKHSYWTAVLLTVATCAAAGGGLAAITDLYWFGNVSAQNVVQTSIVVGSVILIGGILTRCDQVGRLDRAEEIIPTVRELVPQGREAIVQNVYIAWARRQVRRIIRQRVQEALSEVAMSEAGVTSEAGVASGGAGSDVASPHTSGSDTSVYGTPNSHISSSCLSEVEAGLASSALGQMSDVDLCLEPIEEVLEQLLPRDEQGHCDST